MTKIGMGKGPIFCWPIIKNFSGIPEKMIVPSEYQKVRPVIMVIVARVAIKDFIFNFATKNPFKSPSKKLNKRTTVIAGTTPIPFTINCAVNTPPKLATAAIERSNSVITITIVAPVPIIARREIC